MQVGEEGDCDRRHGTQAYVLPRPFSHAGPKHKGPLRSTVITMLRSYRLPAAAYRPPYILVRTQIQYLHWFTIFSRRQFAGSDSTRRLSDSSFLSSQPASCRASPLSLEPQPLSGQV